MSEKDTVTKEYMQDNVVFADAFNYFLYDGEQIINHEQLKPLDTTAIALPYGEDNDTVPVQKYRDILKMVTAKEDDKAAYLLLGIENQSDIHYAMPVRNMLYDALQYASQVNSAGKSHRKGNNKPESSAEYLSGFYKSDRILPVITLTMYFGADEWTAPRNLYQMLDADERILKYINNYSIFLIEPKAIPDENFFKFKSELGQVLKYVKYSKDKHKLIGVVEEDETYRHISRRTANMINVVTGSQLKLQSGKESIDMCEAIENLRNDAIAEGERRGLIEGKIKGAKEEAVNIANRLIEHGSMTLEEISLMTGLSFDEVRSLADNKSI